MSGTNKGKLPDFIGAGFQKCGTKALSNNLSQHPSITIPRRNRGDKQCYEFNFFRKDSNSAKLGLDWYTSHFKDDGGLWGEISPNYSWEAGESAELISKLLPDVKLIFTLRNPVDRAYSAYNMYCQVYPRSKDWSDWKHTEDFMWNLQNGFFSTLVYVDALKEYEKRFPRENIHIVIQERLSKDGQSEYSKIFDFLGLADFEITNKMIHAREYPRLITEQEADFAKNLFNEKTLELYEFLGYEIEEWKLR